MNSRFQSESRLKPTGFVTVWVLLTETALQCNAIRN